MANKDVKRCSTIKEISINTIYTNQTGKILKSLTIPSVNENTGKW